MIVRDITQEDWNQYYPKAEIAVSNALGTIAEEEVRLAYLEEEYEVGRNWLWFLGMHEDAVEVSRWLKKAKAQTSALVFCRTQLIQMEKRIESAFGVYRKVFVFYGVKIKNEQNLIEGEV